MTQRSKTRSRVFEIVDDFPNSPVGYVNYPEGRVLDPKYIFHGSKGKFAQVWCNMQFFLLNARNSKAQTSLLGAFGRHQRHWCGTPNDHRAICGRGILLKRSRLTPENWWLMWLEDVRALPFLGQFRPSFRGELAVIVSGSVSKIPNHNREPTSSLKEPHVQHHKAQLLFFKL